MEEGKKPVGFPSWEIAVMFNVETRLIASCEGVVTDLEALVGRMQRIMLSAAEAEAAKT